jgi:hypothetical protein
VLGAVALREQAMTLLGGVEAATRPLPDRLACPPLPEILR